MIGFELTEEQKDLRRLAREFAEHEMIPRAREYDEKEIFPRDVCEAAFKAGLMNLGVPREQGGPGLNVLDSSIIIEELNYGCSGMANAVGANELATLPLVVCVLVTRSPARYGGARAARSAAPCRWRSWGAPGRSGPSAGRRARRSRS